MPLSSGSKLGPYEIVGPIGAGGMGEVYRARDATLARDVAVKVLPTAFSEDGDRLRRFKQEAQAAAALNHPNILTIFHVGEYNGAPYIVSELLEGESLRQRLQAGPVPLRKTIDYSVQVARGLAAAHDKGIVHRDLKPENVFLTRDGRAKILDFGLAKLTRPEEGGGSSSDALTLTGQSEPGFVLGTVGYMSPEQVRGQVAGPASDLFSFGAILYEMLTGKRAFRGETAADTMSAILKEDPEDLTETNRQIPPALERIVRHCLEKSPEERFQSARDVAFDLEALSTSSGTVSLSPGLQSTRKPKRLALAAVSLAMLAIVAAGAFHVGRTGPTARPSYRALTFRRGTIHAARFTSDGQSIVYSAAMDGRPADIYTTRTQGPESRPRGLTGSTLLAVSSTGEMAVLLAAHATAATFTAGTLARVPLEGGAPREVLPNVESADWGPDGTTLLIARQVGGSDRIEFPPGKVIFEGGAISHPRFSPRGDQIAFFDHPGYGSDDGSVAVVDLKGHKKVLSAGWADLTGLAWSARGDEIWFTGSRNYASSGLFAVTLRGSERQVTLIPGDLVLFDVGRDGRVLLGREDWRGGIYGLAPGEKQERDLSWFDFSIASGLSADGKIVLFWEAGEAGGAQSPGYLRNTDGSPAVRLSDAICWGLSGDGSRAICGTSDGQLSIVPTKTGVVEPITHDPMAHNAPEWFPDEKRVMFLGQEPGHGMRAYVQDLAGGPPRAISAEGASFYNRLSPDGMQLAMAMGADMRTVIYPVGGGDARPLAGLEPGDVPVAWSPDSRFLYCYRIGELPVALFRLELASGHRTPWKQLAPSDPVGITFVWPILFSNDMKSYVYSVQRRLDVLYLVEALH